jgi:hypothetical protein
MNNEPYGWHCFIGKGKEEQDFLFINGKGASKPDANWDKVIPLYTHPVINPYQSITITKIEPTVVSYTHPVKELEPKIKRACKKCIEQQAEIEALKAKLSLWKEFGRQVVGNNSNEGTR